MPWVLTEQQLVRWHYTGLRGKDAQIIDNSSDIVQLNLFHTTLQFGSPCLRGQGGISQLGFAVMGHFHLREYQGAHFEIIRNFPALLTSFLFLRNHHFCYRSIRSRVGHHVSTNTPKNRHTSLETACIGWTLWWFLPFSNLESSFPNRPSFGSMVF